MSLEIKQYKISDVKPAKYNPRDISDYALEGLKESIKKFGIVDPLIINTRSKTLVGGHQRLKAMESLGFVEVPVVEVDLSEAEEKALNITLNNQKISGFYTDTLSELITEIRLELGDQTLQELRLNDIELATGWDSDIGKIDSIEENEEARPGLIKVTCPFEIKDEVLIFLKEKFLETSFEGVHIE